MANSSQLMTGVKDINCRAIKRPLNWFNHLIIIFNRIVISFPIFFQIIYFKNINIMLIIFKVISVKMCLILSKLIFVIISQKFIHKNVLNKKLMVYSYSYMFNQIPRWLKKNLKSRLLFNLFL